ncbi:hypothetical protein [Spirosoma montaniterrae]|uniref:ATP-grasp domain-containing protein n=1 Tax=Spirosoma montaniterrae TaxID=1178516 RepID=A0A1P9WSF5_9BACT|nr:hypothetical protein [Spirosoma montaniterrae]AQG78298.1 hypothetical protein AWR27_02445 [Spirosoma montaniterrae]
MNAARPVALSETIAPSLSIRRPLWLAKWLQYEYWPFYVFFAPMVFYYLWLAIRARSLTFFTAVNPAIPLGGLFGESKSAILDNVPADFLPKTLFISPISTTRQVLAEMAEHALSLPVVCKPDVGERGAGVRVIRSEAALTEWLLEHGNEPFLVQEFVAGPLEFGVFYYRLPNGSASGVTSVVKKEFLTVWGDGRSTVCHLLQQNERARMAWPELKPVLATLGEQIPNPGESVLVQPIGNHCRGTKFLNANYLRSPELDHIFDQIAQSIPGFDYGRFDIRVPSVADLLAGRHIRVLEINGITSEPGHVYDPAYSLHRAYTDIAWHLRLLYEISRQRRQMGIPTAPLRAVWNCLRMRFWR